MARPTTKDDLLNGAEEQYNKLMTLIDSMSDEQQQATFLFEDRDKNVRDVLAHLHEWHNMVERWYHVGVVEGGIPLVPGEGYTWRTLPALNMKTWERYQGDSLDTIKQKFADSQNKMIELIKSHTNEELFSRNVYKWTKTSTLGAYFVGSTTSHYDWAMKKLRKQIKLLKTPN